MTGIKLNKCPFCGSDKVSFMDETSIDNRYRKTSLWPKGVACNNCETQVMFFDKGVNIGFYDKKQEKQRIAEKWNKEQ